jgi:alpha-glucosidase (family GH31 glycosyl hydrolase)
MTNEVIHNQDRKNRIQSLGADIFRVTHLNGNREEDNLPDPPWYCDVIQEIENDKPSKYSPEFNRGLITIRDSKEDLRFQEKSFIYQGSHGSLVFSKSRDELLFGWGEWFNRFGYKKGQFKLENLESPEFLQWRQTYSTIPVFLSNRHYMVFLLNSHASRWKITDDEIRIDIDGGNLDYIVILGKDPKTLIEKYTGLAGRPRLVPKWAFGLWATSYPQEAQFKALKFAREHRERQIPLDVILLDYHWEEHFHNFRWRKKLFPAPEIFISDLKGMGIKTGLIFTPFINEQNDSIKKRLLNLIFQDVSKGCENDDERDIDAYLEGKDSGYFAHEKAEWWFGKGGMLDFTNPHGTRWWNQKMEPLYQSGIAIFKNDDGEYLPRDAHSHNGMKGGEYHNVYGFYYGKAIYEGMEALDQRRSIIFSRSVWAGSQRYPALFLGDQHPDFKNIKKTIRAGLNMSLLGFSYWGADIFGLDGKTTPETFMRYAQWAIFSPIARYFVRPEAIDNTRQPWLQSKEVENHFRELVNFRYQLLPYYYSCSWAAYKSGIPIIRPLFLEFPDDERTWEIDDQVMIGETLLLAPVVESGATSRWIYFPEGEWFDFRDNTRYEGKQRIKIETPLNKVPLFARSGTVLALGPILPSIGEKHGFNQLEMHFWGKRDAQFDLYDDDGLSRNYLNGEFLKTHILLRNEEARVVIQVRPVKEGFLPPFTKRVYTFVLHGWTKSAKIIRDGDQSLRFVFEERNNTLYFVLEADVTREYNICIE